MWILPHYGGMAKDKVLVPRVGIHVSAAGGVDLAPARAREIGCEGFQIFSSSPRQWRQSALDPARARAMLAHRKEWRLEPLAIHCSYLINLAAADAVIQQRSRMALRGELERARALEAEFLVLHPGVVGGKSESEAGADAASPAAPAGERAAAVQRLLDGIAAAAQGFDWGPVNLLIENTAGGSRLAGDFRELRQILDGLAGLPAAACLDTCHCWVAGYDWSTPERYAQFMQTLEHDLGRKRVRLWHANDTQSGLASRLDRHWHIGEGKLGDAAFRSLLQDPRWSQAAFLAETPVDAPGDEARNVAALKRLRTTA